MVFFSSTHNYIWKVSKPSEKYCVLYVFEIIVWIQAKNKASCPYFEHTWRKKKQNIVLVVDPRVCAQQRVSFYSTVIIYKQRAGRLSLCCANCLAHSQHWFLFPCGCAFIVANDERRSSVIVFRSGVFNLFIKLKLRSAAHDETGYVNYIDSWEE